MSRLILILLASLPVLPGSLRAEVPVPAEPLLRDPPPGLIVIVSQLVPPDRTRAIAAKLGGRIEKLTNSEIRLHGSTLRIKELSRKFVFGESLTLRSVPPAVYQFEPVAKDRQEGPTTTTFRFPDPLPNRHGVPFIAVTMELEANDSGFRASATAPGPALSAPTSFWPVDDQPLRALAKRITAGKATHDAKAEAILYLSMPSLAAVPIPAE